jgi:hypothetical protein
VVGLVEHHGVILGQDALEVLVLDGEVGKKQVVVDHDEVGLLGLPAQPVDEALLVKLARLAVALLGRGGDLGPRRVVGGHPRDVGAVARLGDLGPLLDLLEQDGLVAGPKQDLVAPALHPELAQVVASPLEVHRLEGPLGVALGEELLQEGDVLEEYLLLEGLRRRGHDDPLAAQERGDEVGQGLARARGRLDDRPAARAQRLLDRRRHLDLLWPWLIPRQVAREQPARAKKLLGHPSPLVFGPRAQARPVADDPYHRFSQRR